MAAEPENRKVRAVIARPPGHPEHLPWPPKMREYPPDHPARRDDESTESFNEDWARKDFGDAFMNALKGQQHTFQGDWWLLAFLLRCIDTPTQSYRANTPKKHIPYFNSHASKLRRLNISRHLEHARLADTSLVGLNLSSVHLEHATLSGTCLDHADLRNAQLKGANLVSAHLRNANLSDAHLEHAILANANLEHASLFRAILKDATLRRTHLENANLVRANLDHADLTEAVLSHADLRCARLPHARLSGATLSHAKLDEAHLEKTNLAQAHLEHATLRAPNTMALCLR